MIVVFSIQLLLVFFFQAIRIYGTNCTTWQVNCYCLIKNTLNIIILIRQARKTNQFYNKKTFYSHTFTTPVTNNNALVHLHFTEFQ